MNGILRLRAFGVRLRRVHLVFGAVAIGLVAVLAACGSSAPTHSTSSASATSTSATSPSTTSTSSSATTLAATGEHDFTALGCNACHLLPGLGSSAGGQEGIAPDLAGVYGSKVELTNGKTVVATPAYFKMMIDDPGVWVVKGFSPTEMASVIKPGSVTPSETTALIAFIKSLKTSG